MSYYNKNKTVVRQMEILKTFSLENGIVATVYRSKMYDDGSGGNVGASFRSGKFTYSSFLNVESGDLFIGQNSTLKKYWPEIRAEIIRHGGGMHGKVETHSTRTLDQIDNRVELTPSASVKRGPGRPRKIAAEQVQTAPVQTAPTQSQPDLFKILEQLTIRVNALTESVELISGVK